MVERIGHRGCPLHVMENTMGSFAFAFSHGADAVELDVQMSKDGHAVVMHDDTVDRTTDGSGLVADMTLAELKKITVSGGGCEESQGIPLLTEVLQEFAGVPQRKIYIEVKHGKDAQHVARLVNEAVSQGEWSYAQLVMISFDDGVVEAVREVDGQIPLGLTFEDNVPEEVIIDLLKREKVEYINLNIKAVKGDLVQKIHQLGARVNVWTVNEWDEMKQCVDALVDGVMSDDIVLLSQMLDENC